jgi:hypothetical protein
MTIRDNRHRVSRARHCPICDRADWCLISKDSGSAICPRVESPMRCGESGWLHRLRDDSRRPPRLPWRNRRRLEVVQACRDCWRILRRNVRYAHCADDPATLPEFDPPFEYTRCGRQLLIPFPK